ncbi:MAG: sugar transferase [Marinibacterium profundimaris]
MLRRQVQRAAPLRKQQNFAPSKASSAAKRAFDLFGSVTGIVLLAPLLIGAAIAVKLSSPGPVLFCQKRYGKGGDLITVYKFRTMKIATGDVTGVKQTVRNDPRITRVGSVLRKTSIDELPQLFNVLFGTMSIVGPRPHVPDMIACGMRYEDFDERYMDRCAVAPGITGLAQVNGYRGETNTEHAARRRLEYDLEYIRNRSIWMDMNIVLKTVKNEFLKGSGY